MATAEMHASPQGVSELAQARYEAYRHAQEDRFVSNSGRRAVSNTVEIPVDESPQVEIIPASVIVTREILGNIAIGTANGVIAGTAEVSPDYLQEMADKEALAILAQQQPGAVSEPMTEVVATHEVPEMVSRHGRVSSALNELREIYASDGQPVEDPRGNVDTIPKGSRVAVS